MTDIRTFGMIVAALALPLAAVNFGGGAPVAGTAASADAIEAAVARAERDGAIARGELRVADRETR